MTVRSWICFGVIAILMVRIRASEGNGSPTYTKCVSECQQNICDKMTENEYAELQEWPYRLLRWSCTEDCHYDCMWPTIEFFQRDLLRVPQFFGKWPFIRFAGMQEPASAICSILNVIPNAIGLITLRKSRISQSTPMYYSWQVYFLLAINAWFWSTIYHSRDTILTERLDYFCATLFVVSSIAMLVIRVFGSRMRLIAVIGVVGLTLFYLNHVYYLSCVRFDYGYNMKVNITIGAVNGVLWLAWCLQRRRKQRYVWKAAAVVLLIGVLAPLEAFDFYPILWIFDAHSLWHAGTAPLALLWASFVLDDMKFVDKQLN